MKSRSNRAFEGQYRVLSGNTTNEPLNNGQTFTGTAEETGFNGVFIQVATDQDGVLTVEFTNDDGSNYDTTLTYNYVVGDIFTPIPLHNPGGRKVRVSFENDSGSNQTYLRLYVYACPYANLTSSINSVVSENFAASVVRPTDYKYEVAMGKRQGRTTWSKWGYNPDVDSAAAEIIAVYGGTSPNIMITAATLDVVSASANDTSGGTGARTIRLVGIGDGAVYQTEDITMSGTTPVTTSKTWLGLNRVYVLSSGSLDANDDDITIDDTAGTVGIQAVIPAGDSVTQQAIFHSQANHYFLADWLCMNVRKLAGGTAPRVTIRGWSYSRVTDTNYEICRYDIDTGIENTTSVNPSQPFVLGGQEVLYFTAETSSDNTVVNMRFSGIEERVS